jgi:predicted amidophosphoribosyltransferase
MSPVRVAATAVTRAALEALLPALCVACDEVLAGFDRGLCAGCRSRLVPMTEPCCPRCGVPAADGLPCPDCALSPPPQEGTVFWGAYDGVLRRAVLALKHGGHDELGRVLGRRLAGRVGLEPWSDVVSAVAVVPSHRLRRLRRGWSAADWIGREVAAALGRPLLPALRRHGLRRQTGRSRSQRTQLPRGSFSSRPVVRGHRILLVDDVSTTGTTLRRAGETLLRAGARAVYCAAVAHAPDPRRAR